MGSIVVSIPNGEGVVVTNNPPKKKSFSQNSIDHLSSIVTSFKEMRSNINKNDMNKIIHSMKVGIALVLVSLLYILDLLYDQVGENAMWAIMTVVVVFEFYAGAVLSKGLNRGIGTILGGGLGCLAASLAQQIDGIGNGIAVGSSVLIFGAAATYFRMIPSIKKIYDYGIMIFILTFNLVVVSGLRAEKVMEIARERLTTIGMGFAVCIFTSLLVFPMWSSDELHYSTASKFEHLASSIEGSLEEYFKMVSEKKSQTSVDFSECKSMLYSKGKEELLANFAKWEPWHGKFGLSYPWEKYLKIGEVLRELATTILSLKGCIQSPKQATSALRQSIKEPCEDVGSSLAWTLKELGDSIGKMKRCKTRAAIAPKLQTMRQELSLAISPSKLATLESGSTDGLAISSFVFLLMEMVDKVEELTKEVEELGELAGFQTTK